MSGPMLIVLLLLAIAFIVFATAKVRLHPFLVLIVTGYGLGLLSGLPPAETIAAIVEGFGGTIGYIGIVIAAGTILWLSAGRHKTGADEAPPVPPAVSRSVAPATMVTSPFGSRNAPYQVSILITHFTAVILPAG